MVVNCIYFSTIQFYYYFAMVEDFVLRFIWSLTVSIGEGMIVHSEILKTLLASLEIFRWVAALFEIFRWVAALFEIEHRR